MNKKIIAIVICTIFILSGCSVKLGGNSSGTSIIDEYTFVDDMGNLIETGGNYDKIISLSQTHTDNLFELGVGDRIIGVDKNTIYPEEVSSLPRYSLTNEYDVELIEKANPDLILITPSINKSYPAYVTKLETLGYKVVSLMPNNMSEFDIYIEKLAMLTKRMDIYEEKLDDFYKSLDEISEMTSSYESKNVFIESSENGYKTPAEGTLPYLALEYVNANNIAGARHEEYANGLSASYGIEKIMENKDSIDVYLTIQGVDEPGASLVSINQKNEFNDIKAVKENNVFEIDSEIINSFSFRYVTGVYQLSRLIYPELIDDLSAYRNDDKQTIFKLQQLMGIL